MWTIIWPISWVKWRWDDDDDDDDSDDDSLMMMVMVIIMIMIMNPDSWSYDCNDDDDDGRFFRHLGLYYLTIIWLFLNIGCSILDLLYCHMLFNLLLFHCTALSCMLSGLSVLQRQRPLALACLCTLAHQHGPCIHLLSLLRPLLRASLLLPCCCPALQPALQLSQLPPAPAARAAGTSLFWLEFLESRHWLRLRAFLLWIVSATHWQVEAW